VLLEFSYGNLKLRKVTLDKLSLGKNAIMKVIGEKVEVKSKKGEGKIVYSFKELSLVKGDKIVIEVN